MTHITIQMPAAVYYDTLDPNTSGMARDIGLPEPRFARRGRGHTVFYDNVTHEQATEVAEYIEERANTLLAQKEEEGRATLHAAIRAARRIRFTVREGGAGA